MLDLFPLELLLHVRVPQHEVLAEAVDLEVGVVHHEPAILGRWFRFDLLGPLLVDHLLYLLLPPLSQIRVLKLVPQLVVQFLVHQVPVHVLLQHSRIDQVLAAQLIDLLLANEFVLVVDHFGVVLLQLLSDVLDVGHPFGTGAQLRDEIASDPRVV